MDRNSRTQLDLIEELTQILGQAHIRFWLRGGWALDFHVGRITRAHGDIDIVARFGQRSRIRSLLEDNGYGADRIGDLGSIQFSKRGQDVGLAFTWADEMEGMVTPGNEWIADRSLRWPDDAFAERRYTLEGVSCRIMSVKSLLAEKENSPRISGRPLRDKDVASIELLRALLSNGA